jgi:hypothetical protein
VKSWVHEGKRIRKGANNKNNLKFMQCWEKRGEFRFSYTTQAAFYAFLLSGQDGLSVVFYVALAEREFKETNVSTHRSSLKEGGLMKCDDLANTLD